MYEIQICDVAEDNLITPQRTKQISGALFKGKNKRIDDDVTVVVV